MTQQTSRGFPTYRKVIILFLLFTGVSGLIYEILWTRMFFLVLETTVYAVATVLGVYMGCLALGSWIFGRTVDRPKVNGFRLYTLLEGAVGIHAFILPLLMDFSDTIYKAALPLLSESLLNTDDKPLVEFARESIREERIIISELIDLKESVLPIIAEPPSSEEIIYKISSYDQSSRWMMLGQLETCYPTELYKSEIAQRKALLYAPDNQDVRHNLNFCERIRNKVIQALWSDLITR